MTRRRGRQGRPGAEGPRDRTGRRRGRPIRLDVATGAGETEVVDLDVPARGPRRPTRGRSAHSPSPRGPGRGPVRPGLETRPRPEAHLPPEYFLAPGLPVQLLDEHNGWGHLRCHTGWETWADARLLVPLAVHAFRHTFSVPPDGLAAHATPGGDIVAHLAAGVPLAVVAASDDWIKVRAAND